MAQQYNGGFNEHTKAHPKRLRFFSLIAEGKTVEQAVDRCLHVPLWRRALAKGRRGVKKVIRKLFLR